MMSTERTLPDGCFSCGFSLVFCHAVLSLKDAQPCCPYCKHRTP